MADPFDDLFDDIGEDFEDFAGGLKPVTVEQVDAEDGAALATVANVPALKRSRRRQPFGVGGGGEVGQDTCRFVFRAAAVTWTMTARDRITDATGLVWFVESVDLIGFNQLVCVNVNRKRG